MKIVPFDPKYTPGLLEIAREIHATSIHKDMPLDEAKLIRQLSASGTLAADRWFRIAVDENDEVMGAFYGCILRTFFSDETLIKDMGQWTRRDGRQRNAHALLVAAFEEWGRSQGAKKCGLGYSLPDAENIEKLRRVAQFMGYRVTGYNLVKEL